MVNVIAVMARVCELITIMEQEQVHKSNAEFVEEMGNVLLVEAQADDKTLGIYGVRSIFY